MGAYRKLLIPTMVALTVAGCATAAQQQMTQARAIIAETQAAARACTQAANDKPEYTFLWSHAPKQNQHPTLAQMSDPTMLQPDQREPFLAWRDDLNACRVMGDKLGAANPALVPIIHEGQAQADAVRVKLLQQQISWGQATTQIAEIDRKVSAAMTNEDHRFTSELNQQNAAELHRRQAAAEAFSNALQQQQLINAINRPVNTSCNRIGTYTNCTSY